MAKPVRLHPITFAEFLAFQKSLEPGLGRAFWTSLRWRLYRWIITEPGPNRGDWILSAATLAILLVVAYFDGSI